MLRLPLVTVVVVVASGDFHAPAICATRAHSHCREKAALAPNAERKMDPQEGGIPGSEGVSDYFT